MKSNTPDIIEVDADNLASLLAYLGYQQQLSAVDFHRQQAYTAKGILGVVTAYRQQMPDSTSVLGSENDVEHTFEEFTRYSIEELVEASDYESLDKLVADARADAPVPGQSKEA